MAERETGGGETLASAIRDLEYGLLVVLFLALLGLGLTQLVTRQFGLPALPWLADAMRATVLWLTMIGSIVATGQLRHVRIELLDRLLPRRPRVWVRRLVFASTCLTCLALTWLSLDFVALEYEYRGFAFLNVPGWVIQAIVPIGFGIMSARFLAWTVRPPACALHPAGVRDETR